MELIDLRRNDIAQQMAEKYEERDRAECKDG
jgi:hypothetical protein